MVRHEPQVTCRVFQSIEHCREEVNGWPVEGLAFQSLLPVDNTHSHIHCTELQLPPQVQFFLAVGCQGYKRPELADTTLSHHCGPH